MKTNSIKFLTTFALSVCALIRAHSSVIQSTYVGPTDGNWGDAANWSPSTVPNNGGGNTYDVTIGNVSLTLGLNVTINSLNFDPGDGVPIIAGGTAPFLYCDQNFTTGQTQVGDGGIVGAFALDADPVAVDLGQLSDFSGTSLNSGYAYIAAAAPGLTATLKFNGANIVTSYAGIELIGPGAKITDQNGADALTHFAHNAYDGYFDLEIGRNFTTVGDFENDGFIQMFASDPSFIEGDVDTTLTITGDFTDVGFPLDANTDGLVDLLAPGPNGSARMMILGRLTNYDAATQTLHKCYLAWEAANGAQAATTVMGGSPADVVPSEAALILFGPNTGLRDKFGNDALRNLTVSARLLMADRDFMTAGSFTSTSRLSIFGDCTFTVRGALTIRNGFFEISPLTGYARNANPGFPTTPYANSRVVVQGNFNLPSSGILRFHILDNTNTATIHADEAAIFAGSLQVGVEDVTRITRKDRFVVLTADKISGRFSNVRSGRRVKVYDSFDQFGTPQGDPIGSFRVDYDGKKLILSDFR